MIRWISTNIARENAPIPGYIGNPLRMEFSGMTALVGGLVYFGEACSRWALFKSGLDPFAPKGASTHAPNGGQYPILLQNMVPAGQILFG
jgi:hypothetical protein